MDMKTSYAAQLYAKARTAAAPAPQTGQGANDLGQFAQSFADTLAKGEQTATAAMTGGADPQALVQALAASGQHAEVVTVMLAKISQDASTGKKTPEAELRTLAVSYRQLKDDAGYMATLKQLLSGYPSKPYWAEVIGRMSQQAGLNTRLELDLYRLLEQTDNMEDAAEYMEMAALALKAGLPSEAVRKASVM